MRCSVILDVYTPAVDAHAMQALVRRYWDGIWHERNLDLVDELLTDPYTRHSSAGNAVQGRDKVKKEIAQSWDLLHGATTTIEDQVVDGDRVWTRATTTGVNLQTGERSVLTWMIIHRVEDGRFAESWSASIPGVDWR
jgi:ketosteroid isomerase-like protein